MPAVSQEIDGEDDEVVIEVLGALEDVLFAPVALGGDGSDSEEDRWNLW